MEKPATTDYPIHPLLAERYSPRAFADRSVDAHVLGSLVEAARWAPSCFNAQPWTLLLATREDAAGFAALGSCLVEGNAWAIRAPVLLLSVAQSTFAHNGKPNRHALHDVGLALGNLTVQAQALGLSVHQMAGFDADKARQVCAIPDGFEPVAMVAAIGYRGDPQGLPEPLRARESAPRERRPLAEFVFGAHVELGEPDRLIGPPSAARSDPAVIGPPTPRAIDDGQR